MRIIACVIAALALSAPPAAAEWFGNWGAIAFGGPSGSWGTAVDYDSADEARDAAFKACAGKCTEAIVFQRTCGAVAASQDGDAAWTRNRWRDRAIARALGQCRARNGDCELVAWACTGRSSVGYMR